MKSIVMGHSRIRSLPSKVIHPLQLEAQPLALLALLLWRLPRRVRRRQKQARRIPGFCAAGRVEVWQARLA